MIKTWLFVCVLSLGFPLFVCAQNNGDSLQLATILASTKNAFLKSVGLNSRLYQGFSYTLYSRTIQGSGYFLDSVYFQKGQVIYHNVTYNNVPLLYDAYQDQLVSFIGNTATMYTLVKEDVQKFTFGGSVFKLITNGTQNFKSGFYEVLHDNKLSVLAKIIISIQNRPGSSESFFDRSPSFYLLKDEKYTRIGSMADMLRQFPDKREELKQYINRERLGFGSDQGEIMVRIAEYYEGLIKKP